ncbi:MAG: DnaJ domain-containing protein [Tatlockia sp.]|nr:DnaJ domain-containing protein [Tatlockia sp.]
MRSKFNPYEILGVPPTSNVTDIRRAYYKLSLKVHPDRNPKKEKDDSEKKFKKLVKAYEMLTKTESFSKNNANKHLKALNYSGIFSYQKDVLNNIILPDQENEKYEFKKQVSAPNIGLNDFNERYRKLKKQEKLKEKFSTYHLLTYNLKGICNLDNETIMKRIKRGENNYRYISDSIKEKALLWKAEKKGYAPIYLYGTAHLSIDNFNIKDRFDDLFNYLIDQVDVVLPEIESCCIFDQGENIDEFIVLKAHHSGKELRPLENKLIRMTTMSEKLLNSFNSNSNSFSDSRIKELTRSYLTGSNSITMNGTVKSELIKSAIKRNFFWMEDILSLSYKKKTSLVVAGGAHNSGDYGLPNLLAYEGYKLTPLIKSAPPSKKAIIRNLVFGTNNLFFQPEINRKNEQEMQIIPYNMR